MNNDEIVSRLRLWADGVDQSRGVVLAVAIREAADEIELLRGKCAAMNHSYQVCAMERDKFRSERDKAKAMNVKLLSRLQEYEAREQ